MSLINSNQIDNSLKLTPFETLIFDKLFNETCMLRKFVNILLDLSENQIDNYDESNSDDISELASRLINKILAESFGDLIRNNQTNEESPIINKNKLRKSIWSSISAHKNELIAEKNLLIDALNENLKINKEILNNLFDNLSCSTESNANNEMTEDPVSIFHFCLVHNFIEKNKNLVYDLNDEITIMRKSPVDWINEFENDKLCKFLDNNLFFEILLINLFKKSKQNDLKIKNLISNLKLLFILFMFN